MQPDDYKSIDLYLQGELLLEAQAAFEERLRTDSAFAEELAMRERMNTFLRSKAQQPALKARMAELGGTYFGEEANVKQLRPRRWWIGVAAAAIVGLLLWLWSPTAEIDLYAQYAQHPELALAERAAGNDSRAQVAETAFVNADFLTAKPILEELLNEKPADNQLRLALAISALETGAYAQAAPLLQELANGNSALRPYGQWYLALSALRQNDLEKTTQLLEELDNSDPALKAKAQRLLLELNF